MSMICQFPAESPICHLPITCMLPDDLLARCPILCRLAGAWGLNAFPQWGDSVLVTQRKHIRACLFKQSEDFTRQQQTIKGAASETGVLNAWENGTRDWSWRAVLLPAEKHFG